MLLYIIIYTTAQYTNLFTCECIPSSTKQANINYETYIIKVSKFKFSLVIIHKCTPS